MPASFATAAVTRSLATGVRSLLGWFEWSDIDYSKRATYKRTNETPSTWECVWELLDDHLLELITFRGEDGSDDVRTLFIV